MKPARCSPSPRSRTRRGGRACRCTRTRRNRQARSRWMWKSWVSICCHWRGTSYMRPRESGRCMCAAGCGWRSCSTAWKFVACNAGLWGGQSCPRVGLPAGWTRWKGGEEAWGSGDAVLAVDQDPLAFVRLFLQPTQGFLYMLGIDDSYVGRRNPQVRLAGMFRSLVSSRRMVSVDTANIEDCRDLLRSEEHTSELQSLRHLVCR